MGSHTDTSTSSCQHLHHCHSYITQHFGGSGYTTEDCEGILVRTTILICVVCGRRQWGACLEGHSCDLVALFYSDMNNISLIVTAAPTYRTEVVEELQILTLTAGWYCAGLIYMYETKFCV